MKAFSARSWLVVVAVAIGPGCAPAPTRAVDTPAAQRFETWLQAFNTGDESALHRHLQDAFAPDPKRLLRQRIAREMADRFEVVRIDESHATRLVAQLRGGPSGQLFGIALEVEPVAPHRVSRFSLQRLSSQMPEAESLRRGAALVDRLVAQDEFSGVVLLSRNGVPVFQQAYGFADRERKVVNKLDTRFSTASVGKMFTAVAIMQLVQAGKIRLDAPFGAYVTDYPNRHVAGRTTIHQLLTHTGGTGDIDWPVTPEEQARQLRLRTVDDYLRAYGTRDSEFEPGSQWRYSNYGYILLGAVIERVSGQDYYSYVTEHVFAPAGMTASGFPTVDDPATGMATGYTRTDSGPWRAATGEAFFRAIPAGGATTTAADMVRFADALLGHKLLDAAHTQLLTSGKVDVDRGGVYGYGVLDRRAEGGAWFGHGGGAVGISSDLRIFPWSSYVIIALANVDPPVTEDVVHEFTDWLPR